MKIHINTIHYTKNIGGCLQAFALQEHMIKRYAADVKILDYRPAVIKDIYAGFSIPKYVRMVKHGNAKRIPRTIASDVFYAVPNCNHEMKFKRFYSKYYKLTNRTVTTYEQLKKLPNDADILMTGSDQVWNDLLFYGFDQTYFLKYGNEDQKRIAYAASIGNDSLDEKQLKCFEKLLVGYQCISTREKQAQYLLQPVSSCKIETVLDPTLLMTGEEWLSIFENGIEIPKEPYIFYYTINWSEAALHFTEQLSIRTGLQVVTVLARKKFTKELLHHGQCTPDDFVRLISGAQYVVTNSFHGTVFSILFAKQFWTYLSSTRNSRILDLLDTLKIEGHTVPMNEEAKFEVPDIDYNEIHSQLKQLRIKSNLFLDNAIRGENKTDDKDICGIG